MRVRDCASVREAMAPLACLILFATTVAAATSIAPTNSSTGVDHAGTINLQDNNKKNLTALVPLTPEATQSDVGVVSRYIQMHG